MLYHLLTLEHIFRIVMEHGGCNGCNKLVNRVCPENCEILKIKYALAEAPTDAVLVTTTDLPICTLMRLKNNDITKT